jgi:hypothetical protein
MADNSLDQSIRENAQGPAKASGDSGSVEQHSLQDQIEADKYLASKQAAKQKHRGLRFSKLVPPSAQ